MTKSYSLYVLQSPSGKRYVGITKNKPSSRWRDHRALAARSQKTPLCRAIKKYGPNRFAVHVLANSLSRDEAHQLERVLIAEWGTRDRSKGYNVSEGGDGDTAAASAALAVMRADPLKRAIWIERQRAVATTLEARARTSAQAKSRWADPSFRAKMAVLHQSPEHIDRVKKALAAPAVKRKMAESTRLQMAATGAREKFSAIMSKKYSTPEVRSALSARALEISSRPETRAKRKARALASWKRPEVIAARSASHWSRDPERKAAVVAKISAARRGRTQ